MKHILVGVRAAPVRATALRVGTEHVIVHEQMLETETLDRLRIGADAARIGADLGLWEDNAKLHLHLLLIPVSRPPTAAGGRCVPSPVATGEGEGGGHS